MTVTDLRCDHCGKGLAGPEGLPGGAGRLGVRFTYHPGSPALKDDSGLMCEGCWAGVVTWLGAPAGASSACARCGAGLDEGRLVVLRPGELLAWFLCRRCAVAFLNGLRTVTPKLDVDTFRFPVVPTANDPGH